MDWQTWATADVESGRRFEYYRSSLCASFARLTPHRPSGADGFDATMRFFAEGDRQFTWLSAASHPISRTQSDVREAGDEHAYLNFVLRGELRMDQFGQRRRVRPGQLVLVDNARPFDAEIHSSPRHAHFVYRMDPSKFGLAPAEATRRFETHDLSPALRQSLAYASGMDESWSAAEVSAVIDVIDGLLRLISHTDHGSEISPRARITLDRVRALVATRHRDPQFGFEEAARELKLPKRSIQDHLSAFGVAFSELLTTARLESARCRLLATPLRDTSIDRIAYEAGFQDLSTFYRAYKRRFRETPGACRNAAD